MLHACSQNMSVVHTHRFTGRERVNKKVTVYPSRLHGENVRKLEEIARNQVTFYRNYSIKVSFDS
jgi:hypothetical protein